VKHVKKYREINENIFKRLFGSNNKKPDDKVIYSKDGDKEETTQKEVPNVKSKTKDGIYKEGILSYKKDSYIVRNIRATKYGMVIKDKVAKYLKDSAKSYLFNSELIFRYEDNLMKTHLYVSFLDDLDSIYPRVDVNDVRNNIDTEKNSNGISINVC
jgi:hypothetical protein